MKLEIIENNIKSSEHAPILFLHGMWHGAWCWEPYFLPYLEELGYKAYAMSLSNHANSPRKKSFNLLRIADYVEDLRTVVEQIGGNPILVGHSMGGYVIQKYLEKHKAPAAVLLAPVPPFGVWAGTFNVIRKFPLTFLKANLTLNLKRIINSDSRFRHILCSPNISEESIQHYRKKIDTESFLAYIDMLGLNLVNTKKVTSPLLLIGGELDNAVPSKALHKTAKVYKIKPVVFPGMGHNLMLEPGYKEVVDVMVDWLQKESK